MSDESIFNTENVDDSLNQHYKKGKQYQDSMKFTTNWAEYERFYAGDQWAAPTERTRNLPRPVVNVVKYIEQHKKASVLSDSIKMVFTADEVQDESIPMDDPMYDKSIAQAAEGAEKFTKFSDSIWEKLDQDTLNDEIISSAANLGTGLVHYFWNDKKTGGISKKYIGDMEGEFIDPSNCFVGNPQCKDIQKQPWILIHKRENIDKVKKIAENNGISKYYLDMIGEDKNYTDIYDPAKLELNGSKNVTVLTEYYKNEEGIVCFKKAVGDIIIQKETQTKLTLYPIAVMRWDERKKCFYGIGDTEGIIPNQKQINFLYGMMALGVQTSAFPKLVAKEGALGNQTVTNTPGELLIDYSAYGNDGFKYLNTSAFNPQAMNLVQAFLDTTKSLAGANDAAVGEAPGADMAAQAIMLLQKSAGLPLEDIKKRFNRFIKQVGRIWEEFYKNYYNTERSVRIKDINGQDIPMDFKGSDYADFPYSLKIDVGPATTYSEYVAMSTLDKLKDQGDITADMYVKYLPDTLVPNKERLLNDMEKMNQIYQLLEQLGLNPDLTPINPTSGVPGMEGPISDEVNLSVGGDQSLGINPVHEPSLENIGTNNGKMV